MNYEEIVKKKLYEVWKKEAVRIEHINGGWERRKVMLGNCPIKIQGIKPIYEMIATIEDFGIPKANLDKLDMNYDQIFETYEAIRAYRVSVRFLKDLKMKLGGNN